VQQVGGPQQVIIVGPGAVNVFPTDQFGYQSVRTSCPHCHADIATTVEYESGTMTWLVCGIIVLVGLLVFWCALLGCCFIPFCINDCKDVIHSCPACKQTLSRVRRLK
jgi:lipopolysaccharide-induced tumor necrosis factor-alpha factor